MTAEVCPYCRVPILSDEVAAVCEDCGTRHHADCYEENGGCTIFGCSHAPPEEPKLTLSGTELAGRSQATNLPVATPVQTAVAPPPPPSDPLTQAAAEQKSLDELRRISTTVVPSMFSIFGPEPDSAPAYSGPEPAPIPEGEPKSRTTFILLGALVGALGAHNFYAGYTKKAVAQLAITVVTFGFGSPMSWIWAIIDICTVNQDNRGIQFAS